MKKVIVIKGSPRKGANSDALVDAAVAAIGEAEIIEFPLRDKVVNPCKGCEGCKGEHIGCVQKDDYSALLEDLRTADAILLSSPLYFGDVPGTVKNFIDRGYCLFNPAKGALVESKPRKMAVFITCGGTPEEAGLAVAEKVAGSFRVLGITESKAMCQRGCNTKDAAAKNEEAIAKATALGAWIAE